MSSFRALLLAGVAAVTIGCSWDAEEKERGRIVFSSNRDGDFDVYVMDGEGSGLES